MGGDDDPPESSSDRDLAAAGSVEIEERVKAVLVEEDFTPAKAERVATRITRVTASLWMAPLPPPDILRGYEEVVPGAAGTILTTFSSEVAHRQKIDRWQTVLQAGGLACGVFVVVCMLALAAVALWLGFDIVAGAIPATIAGVAGVFVWRQPRPDKGPSTPPHARGE